VSTIAKKENGKIVCNKNHVGHSNASTYWTKINGINKQVLKVSIHNIVSEHHNKHKKKGTNFLLDHKAKPTKLKTIC